jgi:small nuclear ribonucleoprotein (snRNP)-like protein
MNLVIRDAVELLDDNDHGSKRADSELGTIIFRADNILVIAIESPI